MLSTGIPNLDLILGGGIRPGDTMLVIGAAGSGKTTLTMQIACQVAARGQNALYVSTLSEAPTRIIEHMKGFKFFDQSLIGKCLFLLSIYPLLRQGLAPVAEQLVRAVREHQASLVVIDGFMTVHDLHPDSPSARTFLYELVAELAALGATTIITSSGSGESDGREFPEMTMADGVLRLEMIDVGSQTVRGIRASKMRGLAPLLGLHSLSIDENGLTVFPRVESVFRSRDVSFAAQRVPFGLPELDAMMSGGPLAGSTTVLAGALGTGKTLTGLHYVAEGGRRGEASLFVSLREDPAQLFDKGAAFGVDLRQLVDAGLVRVVYLPQVDLVADELAWRVLRLVDSLAPKRLVLDGMSEVELAVVEERRRRGYVFALSGMLRQRGVTSLVTKEIAQVVGPELDFSDTPLAALAENLVLMRYVEFRGEIHRILSVLKMRDSDHDRSIRQYRITDRGLKVMAKMETGEGLLTGIARLPGESRVRRGGATLGEQGL